jgi:NAD(P)-dependent dehydrogenase (short-subunit alcohol dehydrogenase family)
MDLSIFGLANKVAIVTGGGRGLGKGIALGFADVGADVVLCARTAAEIEAVAAEIRGRGKRALALPTDTRYSDQVKNMVDKAIAEFGKVDVLVNNAGGSFGVPFLQMSENAWDAIIRENLNSVFLCTKAVVEGMATQKAGSIINIASLAGQVPFPNFAPYGAAKAGVINLTQTLAVELGPYNIRVNAILPAYVENEYLSQRHREEPELRQRRLGMIPLGRFGGPEDIAAAAIYLASDASSFVTGATILFSGGLSYLTAELT